MFPRGCRVAALCLLIGVAPSARAVAPTVLIEAMTTTELRAQLGEGRTTIIVPVGGTEQNGAHMALGKHNRRVALLAERIALSLGNALVAPVVAYVPEGEVDPPTAHMRFTGTITVPSATFVSTLEAAARSFRRHGFRDVVFLGDHGGYQAELRRVADRLNRAWSSHDARAHAVVDYYEAATIAYPELLRKRGYADAEIGSHAGLADTSLMLALDPSLVRADRLLSPPQPGVADGVAGDPRRANAQLGRLGVDLIVERTVTAIRRSESRR